MSQVGQGAIFHINHVIPRSRGGETTLDNLVLQCPHCSLHKSNQIDALDPQTQIRVSVFHPLQQVWSDHFRLQLDATILGRTPTGRATVAALQMNASLPLTARRMQLALGLLVADPSLD